MFRGISAINIDTKGRLAIPTRYRDIILTSTPQHSAYQLIVTIDTESPCLLLYAVAEWEVIENKLQGLPSFNRATRRIQRLLLGHATELEMDINGRVLIPNPLREYAGLAKQTVLVGQGKKFEIWDEAQWADYREIWLAEESKQQGETPPELAALSL